MKYFLVAGEASGDLHGSNLIKAIKAKDPEAIFQFWGGDLMNAAAEGLIKHYRDVTIMGFIEVILNLRTIARNLTLCKKQIGTFQPDVVILIDYPGFNLRIAEFCKKSGIRTVYYIAPKVWAWKEKRAVKLEKYVDDLLLIFPFETDYFQKWKVKSTFVGNPLLDALENFKPDTEFRKKHVLDDSKCIALLPGSRKQEISRNLPKMLEAASTQKDYQFVIAGAPGIDPEWYAPYLNKQVKIVFGRTYDLLHISDAAIVCSGTATLETALFNVPQICCYAAHPFSFFIARMLVQVPYISLVNLCMNQPVITELIQDNMSTENIRNELAQILDNTAYREHMLHQYAALKTMLGGPVASKNAAAVICRKG